jgi:hypothetical protein
VHTLPAQQGWPAAPHVVQTPSTLAVPPEHTVVAALQAAPVPTHALVPGSQQSGATHAVSGPGQHGVPVIPHALHDPAAQIVDAAAHPVPVATHVPVVSQHPLGHELPAQQIPPVAPHDLQEPPEQTRSLPEHAPSFATHRLVLESQHPPAVHGVAPSQQEWPGVPHAHEPPMHS